MGETLGLKEKDAESAAAAPPTRQMLDRACREERFRLMRENLVQAKLLMAQFSERLDEWLKQA